MAKQLVNPSTLFSSVPLGFSQAVVADGKRTIYCAGQTAWDKDMNFVGVGDFAAQVKKSLDNVRLALEAAGATPQDVVRCNSYVVDHGPEKIEPLVTALAEFFGESHLPSATLLGVACLAMPEFLIEIEVTAVIDA